MVSTTDDLMGGEAPPSHRGGAESKAARQPGRLRRALARVAEAVAATTVFVAATAGSAVVHLGMPVPRRLVVDQLNKNLNSGMFKGRLLIEQLSEVTLWRGYVTGIRVRVFDPSGQQVLLADGVTARLDLTALIGSLRGKDGLKLNLHDASINVLDVRLEQEPDGTFTIARAFESPGPPQPPKPSTGPGPEIKIPGFALHHGWIHGSLQSFPVLDADALEARGDFLLNDDTMNVTVSDIGIKARSLPLPGTIRDVDARLEGHLRVPTKGDMMADAIVHEAQAGRVKLTARAEIAGSHIDATADIPRTAPEALRELVPQAPLYQPVGAQIRAQGELPRMDVAVRSTVGDGAVDVDAWLGLGDVMTVNANVVTRDLEPRAFAPTAPEGRVTSNAHAEVAIGPGDPAGTFSLRALPTVIAGQPTPAVQTEGSFSGSAVKGVLHAQEPGLVAHVNYDLGAPAGPDAPLPLTVDVVADSNELAHEARLGGALGGSAHVTAHGKLLIGERTTVAATASVQASGLRAGPARVGTASVQARVNGDVTSPRLDVQAQAGHIDAGGFPVDRLVVRASGSLATMQVTVNGDTPNGSIMADAQVGLQGGVSVKGKVQGEIGAVDIDMHQRGAATMIVAHARDVDLTKAMRFARVEGPAVSGMVNADVDLTLRGDDIQGTVEVNAHEAGVDLVQGVGATVKATLRGRDVDAQARVTWMDGATVTLATRQAKLAGPAMRPASWQRATFDAGVQVDADLARTMALLPEPVQPLRKASGRVVLTVDAARSDAAKLPDIKLATHTESVDVTLPPGSDQYGNIVGLPQRVDGTDITARLGLEGATEKLTAALSVRDKRGDLIAVEGGVQAPLRRIYARPWEAKKLMETAPVEARVTIPSRGIEELPTLIRPAGIEGTLGLKAEAHGTMLHPALDVTAEATRLTTPGKEVVKEPIDVKLHAGYQGDHFTADVSIAERQSEVATLHGDLTLPLADLLMPPAGGPRWEASARGDFRGLPLQSLAALTGRPIVGCLYGSLQVDGIHKDARVAADLRLDKLTINQIPLTEARITANYDGKSARADVHLREDQGYFDLSASTPLRWGAALAPSLDTSEGAEPMSARLQAKGFRLRPIEPFVQTVMSQLDGQLDADITITPQADITNSRAQGWLTLSRGIAEPIALGQELRDINARLSVTEGGLVKLESLTFRGLAGRATLTGQAQLDQLRLANVEADLVIKERDRFLLTTQGVSLGDISGHIRMKGGQEKAGAPLRLAVAVDDFEFDLANTTTRSLQALDPEPTIRIGYVDPDGKFQRIETTEEREAREERRRQRVEEARQEAALLAAGKRPDGTPLSPGPEPRPGAPSLLATQTEPAPTSAQSAEQRAAAARRRRRRPLQMKPIDQMPLVLDVTVANKTKIRRGSQISIDLNAHLKVGIGDRIALAGQAQVENGYVDIQGRRFFVERAIATFDEREDFANPTISATARYEAGDATRVYADFLGTVEAGKLSLRSDPALSQGEILSLILFGSREGLASQKSSTAGTNRTAQAAGVGGGVVTQGLNEALSGLNLEEVSTRVDTSESGNPRPELAVAITRDVTASISYRLGIPTPGQNPDTTMLKLNYRFKPRWSLETSFGDRGTSILDLLWRYRY